MAARDSCGLALLVFRQYAVKTHPHYVGNIHSIRVRDPLQPIHQLARHAARYPRLFRLRPPFVCSYFAHRVQLLPDVTRCCQTIFWTFFNRWVTLATVKAKEPRVSVRVDAALKARIEAVSTQTGIDEATLVRNCLEAICDHVDKTGRLTFPIELGCDKPARLVTKR